MIFQETQLAGAFIIEPERIQDERGFFARTWCAREFAAHGLSTELAQCSLSYNKHRGTVRGMHYQESPHQEDRIVRCTKGAIYDVVLDLRKDSGTFRKWLGFELTADNRKMLYIPAGCAHGYQTLVDETELFYQMTEFYHPECSTGVRWNDPDFEIKWPLPNPIISDRDITLPRL